MKITKIKRILAKLGIGNPINRLVYSTEEVDVMKKSGEITSYQLKKYKAPLFREKNKGKWGIQVGKIIVNISFTTKEEAEKWAEWNYKGSGNYRVILLF